MSLASGYFETVSRVGTNVLSGYLGMSVSPLELRQHNTQLASSNVSVFVQMIGELDGQIIFSMNEETAKQIVGRMFGGMEVQELDEMGWSALKELSNWFVSGIATEFSNQGLSVNISHPEIKDERTLLKQGEEQVMVTPLESEYGIIDIYSILDIKQAS